jgi:hypothetical protein
MTGDKGPAYDRDTETYHGYALVETWIGRTAVNVGSLTGTGLYNSFVAALRSECPAIATNWCSYHGGNAKIPTNYVKDTRSGTTGYS